MSYPYSFYVLCPVVNICAPVAVREAPRATHSPSSDIPVRKLKCRGVGGRFGGYSASASQSTGDRLDPLGRPRGYNNNRWAALSHRARHHERPSWWTRLVISLSSSIRPDQIKSGKTANWRHAQDQEIGRGLKRDGRLELSGGNWAAPLAPLLLHSRAQRLIHSLNRASSDAAPIQRLIGNKSGAN